MKLGCGFISNIFYFHPYLEGSRYRLHWIGTTRLPQNLQEVRNHTATVHSPSWHRRARAKRSAARHFLKRWTSKRRSRWTPRVASAINLLETHHSRPFLKKARLHMEWHSNWNRWGTSKGKKGSGKGRDAKKDKVTKDNKEQAKSTKGTDAAASFPSYDTVPVSSQSQSSGSSSQPSELRTVMAALLEANPGLMLPPALLAETGQTVSRSKEEISAEQKRLNTRRKAITKLERLQGALAKKKEQIAAYKEFIREKLQTELSKFEKEKTDLEKAISTQQEIVDRVEAGLQDISNIEQDEEEEPGDDSSLASMLGLEDPHAKLTAMAREREMWQQQRWQCIKRSCNRCSKQVMASHPQSGLQWIWRVRISPRRTHKPPKDPRQWGNQP